MKQKAIKPKMQTYKQTSDDEPMQNLKDRTWYKIHILQVPISYLLKNPQATLTHSIDSY